jgi:DnaJ-class molecular chaperone
MRKVCNRCKGTGYVAGMGGIKTICPVCLGKRIIEVEDKPTTDNEVSAPKKTSAQKRKTVVAKK